MDYLFWLIVLGVAGWLFQSGYRSGKRDGSRKGYHVGRSHGRRRR
jgi:hypothetical protein